MNSPYRAGTMMTNIVSYSVALGIAAGAAATAVSTLLGFRKAKQLAEIAEPNPNALLKAVGSTLQNQIGEACPLRLVAPRNSTLPPEARKQLKNRFGSYGMVQVTAAYEKAYYGAEDMAYLTAMGFNSLLLDITPGALFRNGKLGKTPDYAGLDERLDFCRQNNMTAVIRLADTLFFDKKEKGEKNALALWASLAQHCKNNSTVAALLIAPRTLAEGEKPFDLTHYYQEVIKTVRKVNASHLLLLEECDALELTDIIGKDSNCGSLAFLGNIGNTLPHMAATAYPRVVCLCSHSGLPAGKPNGLAGFGYEGYKSLTADCGILRRYAYSPTFTQTPYEDLLTEIKAEYAFGAFTPDDATVNALAPWLQQNQPDKSKEATLPTPSVTFGLRYKTKLNKITLQKGAKQDSPASDKPDENI